MATTDDETKQTEEKKPNPAGADGGEASVQKPEGTDGGASADSEPADKHGQPGINREKYQRDIKAKDDEIAALKAQVAEAAKTEEGRKALDGKIAELEAKLADEGTTHKLQMAGCRDEKAIKAAKSLLADYDGDVDKLKDDCPYLFETKKTGSTGFKHEGGTGDIDAKLDRAMGIKE